MDPTLNESSSLLKSQNDYLKASYAKLSANKSSNSNQSSVSSDNRKGLSLLFTILCIIDLFGVFPVIALPKTVISCGLLGIPVVLFVFGLQLYTATLLGKCWVLAKYIDPEIVHKNRYPYAAIADLAYGARLKKVVTILLDVTVFSAGIPNLLVASQNLQLFGLKMSNNELDISFCVWLLVVGVILCPVMWLGSPKDMKLLAVISVLAVSTVTIIVWYCILSDTIAPQPQELSFDYPNIERVLITYAVIAFQFDIHPMVLTIQVDMEDSSKINCAVWSGFFFSGGIFAVTALLAVHRYGLSVQNNLLQGLPASIPLYVIVLLVTLQLCLSSAVGNSALFQHIEELLTVSRDFSLARCIIRSSLVFLAVFLGEAVPRFDLVMGLVGSTLTGPLMFILPPLFYTKINKMATSVNQIREKLDSHKKHGSKVILSHIIGQEKTEDSCFYKGHCRISRTCMQKSQDILAATVMYIGILATGISTYYSWRNAISYTQFTPSCLLNISTADTYFN